MSVYLVLYVGGKSFLQLCHRGRHLPVNPEEPLQVDREEGLELHPPREEKPPE